MKENILLRQTRWLSVIVSSIGTMIILLCLMAFHQYAPFGNNSFAQVDAHIQYMDFFSYLKHLLDGEASYSFSFDRGLGSNVWAILTYYLFSPWNLLVVFFRQENLHVFYDMLVVIKLALSALTMAFYLDHRFAHRLPAPFLIALGMSFGLMQYNLEQARNVMWLDGVYLLPLILLGIYQIRMGRNLLYFIIPSALAVLFNWYSGFIDLLFAGIWGVWEAALMRQATQCSWKCIGRFFFQLFTGILLAVGVNFVFLLPTITELRLGRISSLDWIIFNFYWVGDITSVFQGLTWGAFSKARYVSLFSGSLVLLGVLGFFFGSSYPKKIKVYAVLLLFFLIATFFWFPLYFLFSLLKDVGSSWYRYSYIAIFFLIWIAGAFFSLPQWRISRWFALVPVLWILCQFIGMDNSWWNVIGTSLAFSAILFILSYRRLEQSHCIPYLLVLLVVLDLGGNAYGMMQSRDIYRYVASYRDYVLAEQEQIDSVRPADGELYRITQTKPFCTTSTGLTANYNEGLAYLYPTVASYTSSPVNAQLLFLNFLGYHLNGENMNIVDTSLLGADSLLGVRYVLSDYAIPGLERDADSVPANQKEVYRNPFALPMAFRVSKAIHLQHADTEMEDPFIFTNRLYADLFQRELDVYRPVPFSRANLDDHHVTFYLQVKTQGAVYGNMPFDQTQDGTYLYFNDGTIQAYARWLSPSAFLVPTKNGEASVRWKSAETADDALDKVQFYQVDESALQVASDEAWSRAAAIRRDSDRELHMEVDAAGDEVLFTSLPAHPGWHVTCNGKEVKPESMDYCFMVIPLEPGHNTITLEFGVPTLRNGALISLLALILCFRFSRIRLTFDSKDSGDERY